MDCGGRQSLDTIVSRSQTFWAKRTFFFDLRGSESSNVLTRESLAYLLATYHAYPILFFCVRNEDLLDDYLLTYL